MSRLSAAQRARRPLGTSRLPVKRFFLQDTINCSMVQPQVADFIQKMLPCWRARIAAPSPWHLELPFVCPKVRFPTAPVKCRHVHTMKLSGSGAHSMDGPRTIPCRCPVRRKENGHRRFPLSDDVKESKTDGSPVTMPKLGNSFAGRSSPRRRGRTIPFRRSGF